MGLTLDKEKYAAELEMGFLKGAEMNDPDKAMQIGLRKEIMMVFNGEQNFDVKNLLPKDSEDQCELCKEKKAVISCGEGSCGVKMCGDCSFTRKKYPHGQGRCTYSGMCTQHRDEYLKSVNAGTFCGNCFNFT